jgi:hypothetical protein
MRVNRATGQFIADRNDYEALGGKVLAMGSGGVTATRKPVQTEYVRKVGMYPERLKGNEIVQAVALHRQLMQGR